MYLTKLVYLCAKAAADYGDPSFTLQSFVTGKAQEDEDYSAFIDKALPIVNEFIQHAYELNKLPCKVENLGSVPYIFDSYPTLDLPSDYGKCVSLFQIACKDGSDYQVVGYRVMGKKISPLAPYIVNWDFYLQYRPKVPYFHTIINSASYADEDEEPYFAYNGNEYENVESLLEGEDIELEEYGFSDSLASICIAYVQGRLMDDRAEGHSREVEAETRLQDITLDETLYTQKRAVRSFR